LKTCAEGNLNTVHFFDIADLNSVQEGGESMTVTNPARDRQEAMRQRILDAARDILLSEGFRGLSIRTISASVGCSVGTIYNYFSDFDDVVLHLNAETIRALDEVLRAACAEPPVRHPAALVDAYFDFLHANDAAWRALFEHHVDAGYTLPGWYRSVIDMTVAHVVEAFGPLLPDMGQADRAELIVGLWAGLHGLASLDREGKLATVATGGSARATGHLLVKTALRGAGWRG
jgi:AcrR family transcriptional regulator